MYPNMVSSKLFACKVRWVSGFRLTNQRRIGCSRRQVLTLCCPVEREIRVRSQQWHVVSAGVQYGADEGQRTRTQPSGKAAARTTRREPVIIIVDEKGCQEKARRGRASTGSNFVCIIVRTLRFSAASESDGHLMCINLRQSSTRWTHLHGRQSLGTHGGLSKNACDALAV